MHLASELSLPATGRKGPSTGSVCTGDKKATGDAAYPFQRAAYVRFANGLLIAIGRNRTMGAVRTGIGPRALYKQTRVTNTRQSHGKFYSWSNFSRFTNPLFTNLRKLLFFTFHESTLHKSTLRTGTRY